MRQITVILLTAVVTATVTVFGMMAIGSNPVGGADANANAQIDVMKMMMRDAKDLPTQSYDRPMTTPGLSAWRQRAAANADQQGVPISRDCIGNPQGRR
jgi:hypothetical protein